MVMTGGNRVTRKKMYRHNVQLGKTILRLCTKSEKHNLKKKLLAYFVIEYQIFLR